MRKPKSHGFAPRVVAIGIVVCLISAACSVAGTGTPPTAAVATAPSPTAPDASGCLVGAAWNNYTEERIAMWDEPGIKAATAHAHDRFEFLDAKSSPDTQRTQIDQFVAMGAKVIIVRAQPDAEASVPLATQRAIDRAVDAGVAVIAYDYLIDSPKVLYVAFDEVETGRMEARAVLAARPTGNYVIIRGAQGQLQDDRLASGIHEILQPAIDKGDIKIVAEPYTENWDPGRAQVEMTTILTQNQNRIDAVIAEWDGMANGVLMALKEAGLDGKVAVAGQGGDMWNLHNVAAGTQTVDVWPDLRLMGTAAGDAAVALCENPDISKVKGTKPFSSPGHNQIPSILLTPQAITKDNLKVVLDAGWTKKADLCASLDPSGAPSVCR